MSNPAPASTPHPNSAPTAQSSLASQLHYQSLLCVLLILLHQGCSVILDRPRLAIETEKRSANTTAPYVPSVHLPQLPTAPHSSFPVPFP